MTTWVDGHVPRIPRPDPDKLLRLLDWYEPLVSKEDDTFWEIKAVDPIRIAYLWDPKFIRSVEFSELYRSEAFFTCGYVANFKPTVAEVLAQIPDQVLMLPTINRFWIDFSTVACYTQGDGHRATIAWGTVS